MARKNEDKKAERGGTRGNGGIKNIANEKEEGNRSGKGVRKLALKHISSILAQSRGESWKGKEEEEEDKKAVNKQGRKALRRR